MKLEVHFIIDCILIRIYDTVLSALSSKFAHFIFSCFFGSWDAGLHAPMFLCFLNFLGNIFFAVNEHNQRLSFYRRFKGFGRISRVWRVNASVGWIWSHSLWGMAKASAGLLSWLRRCSTYTFSPSFSFFSFQDKKREMQFWSEKDLGLRLGSRLLSWAIDGYFSFKNCPPSLPLFFIFTFIRRIYYPLMNCFILPVVLVCSSGSLDNIYCIDGTSGFRTVVVRCSDHFEFIAAPNLKMRIDDRSLSLICGC